jgi:hypothetical protein
LLMCCARLVEKASMDALFIDLQPGDEVLLSWPAEGWSPDSDGIKGP